VERKINLILNSQAVGLFSESNNCFETDCYNLLIECIEKSKQVGSNIYISGPNYPFGSMHGLAKTNTYC